MRFQYTKFLENTYTLIAFCFVKAIVYILIIRNSILKESSCLRSFKTLCRARCLISLSPHLCCYSVFIKYCFFPLKMLWFFWTLPVLLQRWWSTCLVCVHIMTPRENRERPESKIFKNIPKNTTFNEHPVDLWISVTGVFQNKSESVRCFCI